MESEGIETPSFHSVTGGDTPKPGKFHEKALITVTFLRKTTLAKTTLITEKWPSFRAVPCFHDNGRTSRRGTVLCYANIHATPKFLNQ